jgi:RNA-directed DNA polymerase
MSRLHNVTREEVEIAWKAVRRAGGSAGYDGQTIEDVERELDNQLYKIWNRMSSGSLQAQPVLLIEIPKAKGGVRCLGIPTVTDRVAQMVIKNRLEMKLEEKFHVDSYAYRPNKSAIEAVGICRQRCFTHEWLLEIDIKRFFDEIDHEILEEILARYTTDKTIVLYAKRFLKAKGKKENGEEVNRERGTTQGGVISPLLANLYLHEAFDSWMEERFPGIKFERYADDIVMHCVSENQAWFMKNRVEGRLKQFKLMLHSEKTRVVYTGTSDKHDGRGHGLSRKFTFLGYDFKPRMMKGGRLVFTPGIGKAALKKILVKIKSSWCLRQNVGLTLEDIARKNNVQIRGWINYYGYYRRSELYKLADMINTKLVWFLKRKRKSLKTWKQGWRELQKAKERTPRLFCHWHMISQKRGAV